MTANVVLLSFWCHLLSRFASFPTFFPIFLCHNKLNFEINQRFGQLFSTFKQIRPELQANLPKAMGVFAHRPRAKLLQPQGKSARSHRRSWAKPERSQKVQIEVSEGVITVFIYACPCVYMRAYVHMRIVCMYIIRSSVDF